MSNLPVPPLPWDYQTRINPLAQWGVWEGWGTSLAWWASTFGDRDDIADILFTTKQVPWRDGFLPGLGLNIVRYNAGASSENSIDGESMQKSPYAYRSRLMDGYWLNWFSEDPLSSSWNWYVDANQRNMMWRARDRGANHFELFSNSPMWWMLYNHNPSGGDCGRDNLQPSHYRQHAVYLATIARYAHDNWGIDFESVEPFNEPSAGWWDPQSPGDTQEGCHFDVDTQKAVIFQLRSELDSRGLGWMMVAASDENRYDDALATWNALGLDTRAAVGRINVHGYQYGGGRRDLLYAAAQGKPIWNSEYGENDATGMSLASNLNLDFRWLHPSAWVYWQALDGGGWGLIDANIAKDSKTGTINDAQMKYFVLAQFTRHIREGMRIIDGGDANTVAAYDRDARKVVIVTTNYGAGQWINFDLSAFASAGGGANGLVHRWATQTNGSERYVYHADTYLHGRLFWSWFAPNAVQTFEVENVDL